VFSVLALVPLAGVLLFVSTMMGLNFKVRYQA
jgi:hypothetical protein